MMDSSTSICGFRRTRDIVLLDYDIVATAPIRLIISGMGDALATYFETRACMRSDATSCMGGKVSKTAMALSELCYQTLISDGPESKAFPGKRRMHRRPLKM